MSENIIIPGHYQSKDSFNSEKPDIMRLLGPDKNKEGYWINQDKKSIPEYELTENWILLDTSSNKEGKKLPPINIFAGIGDVDDNETFFNSELNPPIAEDSSLKFTKINEELTIEPKREKTKKLSEEILKKVEIPFDISIIEKINIDNLNKIAFDKFGIDKKFRKPIINVNLPIEFNYDINKLRQTIDLLELDENIIINFLIEQLDLNSIKPLLKSKIKEYLIKENEEIIQPNIVIEKQIIDEIPEKKVDEIIEIIPEIIPINNEKDEILKKGISEIENYITSKIIGG